MSHGRPGDNPISDILFHDSNDYTPEIRTLFKEVYESGSKHFKIFNDIDLYKDSEEVIMNKLLSLKTKFIED